jgi:hypothetical protein
MDRDTTGRLKRFVEKEEFPFDVDRPDFDHFTYVKRSDELHEIVAESFVPDDHKGIGVEVGVLHITTKDGRPAERLIGCQIGSMEKGIRGDKEENHKKGLARKERIDPAASVPERAPAGFHRGTIQLFKSPNSKSIKKS